MFFLWHGATCAQNVGTCHHPKKRGPDQCWWRWTGNRERVRHSSDLRFEGLSMRRANYAGRPGDWDNYLAELYNDGRPSVWASVKLRECYNEIEE